MVGNALYKTSTTMEELEKIKDQYEKLEITAEKALELVFDLYGVNYCNCEGTVLVIRDFKDHPNCGTCGKTLKELL